MNVHPIGTIRTDFSQKFGIPRQPRLVPGLIGEISFFKPFDNADVVRGLADFSHIWLIWQFSKVEGTKWNPTVRPPRLGGKRKGVFATRSPLRPNPIGISAVKLEEIIFDAKNRPILKVSGVDLMDQTPILDIKPYIASDAIVDASKGFTATNSDYELEVTFPQDLLLKVPVDKRSTVMAVLAQDPRPTYHDDPRREYGMVFAGLNIRFRVCNKTLSVFEVGPWPNPEKLVD